MAGKVFPPEVAGAPYPYKAPQQFEWYYMPHHHITRWFTLCLRNVAVLFNLPLTHLVAKPLLLYSVQAYVNSHATRLCLSPFGLLIANRLTGRVAAALLRSTPLPRLLRGQSVYACYTVP